MRAASSRCLRAPLTRAPLHVARGEVAQGDCHSPRAASTGHNPLGVEFAAPATAPEWVFTDAEVFGETEQVVAWEAGTMFRAPLDFSPNGGGVYVNRYTIVLDVLFPPGTDGWQCLLQTNESNANDADWCVNGSNGIGISGNYGGFVADGEWNRIALVVDLVDGLYTSYVNGIEVQQNTGLGLDGRFSLGATVIFFADDTAETSGGLVNTIQVWDRALCAEDLDALGSPGDGALDPAFATVAQCETQPGNLRIKEGPYLQWQTQNAMTVMWETTVGSDSTLVYARGEQLFEIHDPSQVRIHEIRLTGLDPGEVVEYSVTSRAGDEEVSSDTFSLQTAPPEPEPFRFTVWGDSQDNPGVFGRLVSDMIRHEPQFAVSVGDVVGTGSVYAQWGQQLLTPIWPLARHAPFWVAIGNHEQQWHWFDDYMAQPGNEHWFSFDNAGCHFVILDTNRPFGPGTEQYQWLVDDLFSDVAQQSDWLFTFHHHPPFSEIYEEGIYAQLRSWIVPIYEEAGVDVNFTGHIHDYERGVFVPPDTGRRIAYVQTSGGGGRLWDDEFDGEYDEIEVVLQYVHHYCLLDVTPERLRLEAIDLDGTVIDRVTLDAIPRDGEPPIVPPAPEEGTAASQWDFAEGDLTPTYGPGEITFHDGAAGATAARTAFGKTGDFGIDDIDGVEADVMLFPRASVSSMGFVVEHGAPPNNGVYVNAFTIIFDLYIPAESFANDSWLGLYNSNATNSNDGDLFVRLGDGGVGISGQYDGAVLPDTWHRIAFAFEVAGGATTIAKYIDGVLVGTQSVGAADGRWSLYSRFDGTPWFFLLTDDNGDATSAYLSSFFFVDAALARSEIEALGGADADGVLPESCEPNCGETLFARGDVNADAVPDISDVVFLLGFLFVDGEQFPLCEKAGDSDDNGRLELTDAISLLDYLFRGGRHPPTPFLDCGRDPTEDDLGCQEHAPCAR